MPSALQIRFFLLALFFLLLVPQRSGQPEAEWCVADEQTLDMDLRIAMDWACWNGANCAEIQPDGLCYLPNTTVNHASFAFNSYYQKMKHQGGDCYFRAAALVTALDPSHGPCIFEWQP